MCQMLEVSEKGYANWRKRGKSQRKRDDEIIMARIEDAYYQHRDHYGSPRIHAALKEQGISCGRRRVARLMQENQLSARKKRRKVRTTDSNHQFPIAPKRHGARFYRSCTEQKVDDRFHLHRHMRRVTLSCRRVRCFFEENRWMVHE
jgi:putative transposase